MDDQVVNVAHVLMYASPRSQATSIWQVLSGLLVPIIAVFGAWIAHRQYSLARHKFKLDLFEKRYAVFAAVRQALSAVMVSGRFQAKDLAAFRIGIADAYFLFDKKLRDYLAEIDEHLVRFHTNGLALSELQGRGDLTPEQEEHRLGHVDEDAKQLTWLTDQLPLLREKFAPYLTFEKWK